MKRACLALMALFALPSLAAPIDHQPWDALLERHVTVLRGGQASTVNYAGLATQLSQLKSYLGSLSSVTRAEFDRWPGDEQLAFLINAYNAWTVRLILDAYPGIDSIKDIGGIFGSPWKKDFIPLLGATRSLDDIEHGLIRGSGRYNDPRIHFAVNCASVGCPALRAEAYYAVRLDRQLEEQTRDFLADRSRNRLEGGVLRASAIFDWYEGDFTKGWRGARSLGAFLALYGEPLGLSPAQLQSLAAGKIGIEFLEYDWKLNATAAAQRIDLSSSAPNAPWRIERFDSKIPATTFRAVAWDGANAIESVANASMALLVRPIETALTTTPVLCWRWRIDAPLKAADMATKSGDDFAARVYVAFRLSADAVNFATRTKLRLARAIYGDTVPDAAINYVWDNRYAIGTVKPSAYTDRTQVVVLRSGDASANSWVTERRDVLLDLQNFFGADNSSAAFVAIGSDTDNTHEYARAGFADIHLVSRNAPCAFASGSTGPRPSAL